MGITCPTTKFSDGFHFDLFEAKGHCPQGITFPFTTSIREVASEEQKHGTESTGVL
jgi:hypothetical protein